MCNLYRFVNGRIFVTSFLSCMLFSLFLHFSFLGDFRKLKL
ncbi:hypothetical protein MCHI_002897 [Candidatus Magnetoovum chiemensis]|nr:hypothetical protein MCHI_002897 [Candidatus Magnetoovum chiemensis]